MRTFIICNSCVTIGRTVPSSNQSFTPILPPSLLPLHRLLTSCGSYTVVLGSHSTQRLAQSLLLAVSQRSDLLSPSLILFSYLRSALKFRSLAMTMIENLLLVLAVCGTAVAVSAICPAGSSGDPCILCPVGSFSSGGNSTCLPCSSGYMCPLDILYNDTTSTVYDDGGSGGSYSPIQFLYAKIACSSGKRENGLFFHFLFSTNSCVVVLLVHGT